MAPLNFVGTGRRAERELGIFDVEDGLDRWSRNDGRGGNSTSTCVCVDGSSWIGRFQILPPCPRFLLSSCLVMETLVYFVYSSSWVQPDLFVGVRREIRCYT